MMSSSQGFSLIETLIALCLLSSVALSLLNQQWRMAKLLNAITLYTQALMLLDNAAEQIVSGLSISQLTQPLFTLKANQLLRSRQLEISWTTHSTHVLHQLVVA